MDERARILVTYGCHLKELFAAEVGRRFAESDLDNVVVARWRGIRGMNRNAQFRRDVGAKYGIDLHDNTRRKEEVIEFYHKYPELIQHAVKYGLNAHMGFEKAIGLITPFMERWNKEHGHECDGSGCECYYTNQLRYGIKRPCRANVIAIEFYRNIPNATVNEAVVFLSELVKYLQSDG